MQTDQYLSGSGGTVLLVDDNAIQAATRQAIIKRAGFNAISSLSPIRALEEFRINDFSGAIGLVITDHIMPGMTGSEFVRELRKLHPEMPIIVISGLLEAEDEYQGLNVRFLMKPVPPESLLANVRGMLVHHQEGAA